MGPLRFEFGGIDPAGTLDSTFVQLLASGTGGTVLSPTSVVVQSPALAALVASEPRVLIADAFRPDPSAAPRSIVEASVKGSEITIATDPSQGAIPALGEWQVLRRYFQTSIDGIPASYPPSAEVTVAFQGAEEVSAGSMIPDAASIVGPTADIGKLQGKKLFRFSVDFDRNAGGGALGESSPRPGLLFLKFPLYF